MEIANSELANLTTFNHCLVEGKSSVSSGSCTVPLAECTSLRKTDLLIVDVDSSDSR